MPQLGRIRQTFQDGNGNAVVGLSVEVRKQGATVNGLHGGANTSFLVNDPGGITSTPQDQLQVGTDASVTRAVSSVAATNATVGAPGFTDVQDDARLTVVSALPTIYNDAQGAETKTNPLTTDANGEVVCWAPIVPYDLHASGAGYTTRLIQDVVPEGQESVLSNIFPSASSVAFQKDTLRAQVSGSKLERWLSATTEKFYIGLNASLNPVLPAHNVAGAVTIDTGGLTVTAGGVTITGNSTITGTLGGLTGLTVASGGAAITGNSTITGTLGGLTGLTIASGDLTATSSELKSKRLKAAGGTGLVAGDFALGAGWGNTAAITTVLSGSRDQRGAIRITCNGSGIAANPTVTLTFKDGAWSGGESAFVTANSGTGNTVLAASDYWYVAATTTQAVFWYGGTPVAGRVYELSWHVVG